MARSAQIWKKALNLLLIMAISFILLTPVAQGAAIKSGTSTATPDKKEETKAPEEKPSPELMKAKQSELSALYVEHQKTQGEFLDLEAASNKAHANLAAAEKAGYDSDDPALAGLIKTAQDADQALAQKKAELDTINQKIDETGKSISELQQKLDQAAGSGYDPSVEHKTLIPSTELDQQQCFNVMYALQLDDEHNLENLTKADLENLGIGKDKLSVTEVLGCAIKTGMVKMWMLPVFIKYIIDFLLSVAGLIAVLFLVVGGYLYMFGGLASDKDRGKKAILYGVVGFVVALLAWAVVNAVQILVTS